MSFQATLSPRFRTHIRVSEFQRQIKIPNRQDSSARKSGFGPASVESAPPMPKVNYRNLYQCDLEFGPRDPKAGIPPPKRQPTPITPAWVPRTPAVDTSPVTPGPSRTKTRKTRVNKEPVFDSPLKRGFQYLCDNFIPSLGAGATYEDHTPDTPSRGPRKTYEAPGGFPGMPIGESDGEEESGASNPAGPTCARSPSPSPPERASSSRSLHQTSISTRTYPVDPVRTATKRGQRNRGKEGRRGSDSETEEFPQSQNEKSRHRKDGGHHNQHDEADHSAREAEEERSRKRGESRREREDQADREGDTQDPKHKDREERVKWKVEDSCPWMVNPEAKLGEYLNAEMEWLVRNAGVESGTEEKKKLEEEGKEIQRQINQWLERCKSESTQPSTRAFYEGQLRRRRIGRIQEEKKRREREESLKRGRMLWRESEKERKECARVYKRSSAPRQKPGLPCRRHYRPREWRRICAALDCHPLDLFCTPYDLLDVETDPPSPPTTSESSGQAPVVPSAPSPPDVDLKKFSKDVSSYVDWYDKAWTVINSGGRSTLTFSDVPWPICPFPSSSQDVTPEGVKAFLEHRCLVEPSKSDPAAKPTAVRTKRVLKKELLHWHPDKLCSRVLLRAANPDEHEAITVAADVVQRVLTDYINGRENVEGVQANQNK